MWSGECFAEIGVGSDEEGFDGGACPAGEVGDVGMREFVVATERERGTLTQRE